MMWVMVIKKSQYNKGILNIQQYLMNFLLFEELMWRDLFLV